MKKSKNLIALFMVAAFILVSLPGINVQAASLTYKNLYTKSISMEKAAVTVDDSASAAGTASTEQAKTLTSSKTVMKPQTQEESLMVMKGMQFVISVTRYETLIKTSKNKSNFKFSSSNKKVAKVSSKGVVTTLKNGKCDITIKNKTDEGVYILHLDVKTKLRAKKVKLNLTSKTFKTIGKTQQLVATVKPYASSAGKIPMAWYSTNTKVAKVDELGLMTITGYGTCEIYCEAGSNRLKAKCKITVKDPNKKKVEEEESTGGNLVYNTGKVVDISQHNVVTDWAKLKANCDAVIIRIGYRGYSSGTIVQDSSFNDSVYKCKQYGIPYSVYFFTTATTAQEGAEEASWVASHVSGQNLCFPAFIDSEYSNTAHNGRSDHLSRAARTAAVRAAIQGLNGSGVGGGIYGSTSWLNNQLDMSQVPGDVWVAHYASSCGYGGSYRLWQYTSTGSGYGVRTGGSDRCDVSYWYD